MTDDDPDDPFDSDRDEILIRSSTALSHFQSASAELDLAVEEIERLQELLEDDPTKTEGKVPIDDDDVDQLEQALNQLGSLVSSEADET